MSDTERRLTAICDLSMAAARADSGRHEYDGVVQDLSRAGVARALAALGGPAADDAHDEARLAAAERSLRTRFGELELHRRNPTVHIENLELYSYDRAYAPPAERAESRRAHLRAWPDAVDAAIATLDRVPAPLAAAGAGEARSLLGYLGEEPEAPAARAAVERLVAHLEAVAREGDPELALGAGPLAALAGADEAVELDLDALARRAESERLLWWDRLREACGRIDASAPVEDVMTALLDDHPAGPELLGETEALVRRVLDWTAAQDLMPEVDGECLVGPTPASQGFQVAAMYATAPGEPDAPSLFCVTPPDPAWPAARQREWLHHYHRSGLANIALHEVAPGHFAHARARRRVKGTVRKTLSSPAFTEGWAHYTEQLALELDFADGDPRFTVAVARDALLRITRLACVIGLHTGRMDLAEAAERYRRDAFVAGDAASSAVGRVLRDPTTMAYSWGRFAILDLREEARRKWGAGFSLKRFHGAMLALGSPQLGLLDEIFAEG